MSDPIAERTLRLDESERIDEDLPCRACDYNLRGLHLSADCPECSTPVARSARPDLLRFSDPAWLARLAGGMSLVVFGILAAIAAAIVMAGTMVLLPVLGVSSGTRYALWAPVSIATSLVPIVGVWLATTPEPGRPEPAGKLTVRRTARWCTIAQVTSGPVQMLMGSPGGYWSAGGLGQSPMITATMIAATALGLVSLIGQAAVLVYLRRLALRIPYPRLARNTKIVTWGYMGSQGAGAVLGVVLLANVSSLTAANPSMTLATAAAGAGCTVGLGSLVFGVWMMVLLFRFRKAFKHAAQESRSLWGTGL